MEPQQVVPAEIETAERGLIFYAAMKPVPIIPNRFDRDAHTPVVGDCGFQMGEGAMRFLIGEDVGIRDARGVIDAHILPADAACVRVSGSLTGYAVSGACKPPELLDIEMEHVARIGIFIAPRCFSLL